MTSGYYRILATRMRAEMQDYDMIMGIIRTRKSMISKTANLANRFKISGESIENIRKKSGGLSTQEAALMNEKNSLSTEAAEANKAACLLAEESDRAYELAYKPAGNIFEKIYLRMSALVRN
jgi:seryl-tRNA synthetase